MTKTKNMPALRWVGDRRFGIVIFDLYRGPGEFDWVGVVGRSEAKGEWFGRVNGVKERHGFATAAKAKAWVVATARRKATP